MAGAKNEAISPITMALARYIAGARERTLPEAVVTKTKQHIVDTLAAMVSGSRLKPGEMAARYVGNLGGVLESTVIGTGIVTAAANAALANGMMGHADETDDSHLGGRFHPGCGIVAAALAVAEKQKASGSDLIRAVALGYDVGARVCPALGLQRADTSRYSTHSLGNAFGAAAASAALLHLNERQARHVLSFACQQASGIPFWNRDPEHIEKAFDFGGMGARNGVWSASMVAAGFTATEDPLSGKHNLFAAFGGEDARPEALSEGLGERYEMLAASIKKWSVGSPIQAALDSLTFLIDKHGINKSTMARMVVHMPDDRLHIVNDAPMPDICLQYLLAVTLADGTLTFASAHDEARMDSAEIRAVRQRIEAVPSRELTEAKPARQAIVEVITNTGEKLTQRTRAVRGTPDNPMTQAEIAQKAVDLMVPVIGSDRAAKLVQIVGALDELPSVLALRPLLQA